MGLAGLGAGSVKDSSKGGPTCGMGVMRGHQPPASILWDRRGVGPAWLFSVPNCMGGGFPTALWLPLLAFSMKPLPGVCSCLWVSSSSWPSGVPHPCPCAFVSETGGLAFRISSAACCQAEVAWSRHLPASRVCFLLRGLFLQTMWPAFSSIPKDRPFLSH